jgi:type VI secretion system protein ImpJ
VQPLDNLSKIVNFKRNVGGQMSWKRKVVWAEGMLLQPQHFQQAERYQAHVLDTQLHSTRPYAWGFVALAVDPAMLAIGKIGLTSAKGLFPDGTAFDMPTNEPLPMAIDIPSTARDVKVLLAVPAQRPGARDSNSELEDVLARFNVNEAETSDTNTGGERTALLQVGSLNASLILQIDATDAWTTLGVVKIVERRADNQVVIDKGYIAPTLDVQNDAILQGFVRELLGLLRQRGDALSCRLSQTGSGGVSEVADFLLLQTVNRHEPVFKHLTQTSILHPQHLYEHCLSLAGDLATFRGKRRVVEFDRYVHDDLAKSFTPLIADLRLSLSMVLEQSAIQIELHERKMGVRVGILSDGEMRKNATFVLTVSAQIASESIRARFPSQVKIGPVEKIRDLVNLQLPGVALVALPVAPRQIPFHTGASYFELETRGNDLWRQLDQSGGLAIHVAGDFPGLELGLWAIRT